MAGGDPGIIVIGGGITGLAAANRLLEASDDRRPAPSVTLFEAGRRPGGVIRSEQRGGFIIEHGPDSVLTARPWALELFGRLGLTHDIVPTAAGNRLTLVVRNGKLLPLPDGFRMLAPTQLWPFLTSRMFSLTGKLRIALELVVPPRRGTEDESVADFISRRFGREALERVGQPMVGGIYTADLKRLSLRATLPQFVKLEQEYGSVIQGLLTEQQRSRGPEAGARYGLFVSLAGGMQVLVDTLAGRLGGVVQLRRTVRALRPVPAGWEVLLEGGDVQTARAVILAVPAFAAAGLLQPLDARLAAELAAIKHASSAVINLAYARQDVPHPLNAFGFVVPAIEGRRLIACSFSSVKFPHRAPPGQVLLRCFVGGVLQPELLEQPDAGLIGLCQEELAELLDIQSSPLFAVVQRHAAAMPQYEVGHPARVANIRRRLAELPGLALAGNALDGIGIPDCIHSGEQAAEQMLAAVTGTVEESG